MIRRLFANRSSISFAASIAVAVTVWVCPTPIHAAEGGATVSGKIDLPPTRLAAPARGPGSQGYVKRAKNPLRPPSGVDPRPDIIVVLAGKNVASSDRNPMSKVYSIVGENFASNMLPVVHKGKIIIRNKGVLSRRLYSKLKTDVVPAGPIGKKGERTTASIVDLETAIDIRDHDSPHFLAHIVAFRHRYFSVVDHDGKFEITGVPPGTWTVKVWYRDGWLSNLRSTSVAVGRSAKSVKITLPPILKTRSK